MEQLQDISFDQIALHRVDQPTKQFNQTVVQKVRSSDSLYQTLINSMGTKNSKKDLHEKGAVAPDATPKKKSNNKTNNLF